MTDSRGVVRRYYAYCLSNSYGFYLPVGILYLTDYHGYGMDVIGLTQAAFLLSLMAAEIPTGYVGDRIGRRASLALGNPSPHSRSASTCSSTRRSSTSR